MFKILISTFVLFSSLSFANAIDEMKKCEKTYDECSMKCEQKKTSNDEECYKKCDDAFDQCDSSIKKSNGENSQDQEDSELDTNN